MAPNTACGKAVDVNSCTHSYFRSRLHNSAFLGKNIFTILRNLRMHTHQKLGLYQPGQLSILAPNKQMLLQKILSLAPRKSATWRHWMRRQAGIPPITRESVSSINTSSTPGGAINPPALFPIGPQGIPFFSSRFLFLFVNRISLYGY